MFSGPTLKEITANLAKALSSPSTNESRLLTQLDGLATRLAAGRLQLAVVGQFKRGKSTLLNALLGAEVLPSGVLPVTAIVTFIEPGPPGISLVFGDGRREDIPVEEAGALRATLEGFVSEAGNPHNRLDLRAVHVRFQSPFLAQGITLIDTPGLGSTLAHNTRAAEAALPEADVALFLLSPDPPITQGDVDYLRAIRNHAEDIVVVMNKADLATAEERRDSVVYAEGLLREADIAHSGDILCVAASQGLRAQFAGDAVGKTASGLVALERRLAEFAGDKREAALDRSVRRKAAGLLGALALENDVVLGGLRLPAERLAACGETLAQAMRDVDAQRRQGTDLLAGDRRRAIEALRAEAQEVDRTVRASLQREARDRIEAGENADTVLLDLLARTPGLFGTEFARLRDEQRRRVRANFEEHAGRAEGLAEAIHAATSDALGTELRSPGLAIDADFDISPAWFARRQDTLNPLPPGAFERLLPAPLGRLRAKARVAADLGEAITRNVEKLRWSLQQATEEAFRSFERRRDEALDQVAAATDDALRLTLARRRERAEDVRGDIDARLRFRETLMPALASLGGETGTERGGSSIKQEESGRA